MSILEITASGSATIAITTSPNPSLVITESPALSVLQINEGSVGPQGPQGPPGIGNSVLVTATTAIGGNRAVMGDGAGSIAYADSSNLAHRGKCIGLTMTAASAGGTVEIAVSGDVTEPTWNWSLGPVYLGTNGLLTQTVPTSGYIQVIGTAMSPTRMTISIQQPIILN